MGQAGSVGEHGLLVDHDDLIALVSVRVEVGPDQGMIVHFECRGEVALDLPSDVDSDRPHQRGRILGVGGE